MTGPSSVHSPPLLYLYATSWRGRGERAESVALSGRTLGDRVRGREPGVRVHKTHQMGSKEEVAWSWEHEMHVHLQLLMAPASEKSLSPLPPTSGDDTYMTYLGGTSRSSRRRNESDWPSKRPMESKLVRPEASQEQPKSQLPSFHPSTFLGSDPRP